MRHFGGLLPIVREIIHLRTVLMSGNILNHSHQNSLVQNNIELEKFPILHACNCSISFITDRLQKKTKQVSKERIPLWERR